MPANTCEHVSRMRFSAILGEAIEHGLRILAELGGRSEQPCVGGVLEPRLVGLDAIPRRIA